MGTRSRFVAGVEHYFDSVSQERMLTMHPIFWEDDFVGAGHGAGIPAAAAPVAGYGWVKKIVGVGPPTVAFVQNAASGQVQSALTATSEKQDSALYWNDNLGIDVTKVGYFEARFRLSVLPSVAGVLSVIGLASSWIDGPTNNTCYMFVGTNGSGALLVQSFDGVTTINAAASNAKTLLATDWAIVRIDFADPTDIKIFVNGDQITTTGQINFAATGTLAVLQAYAAMYKVSGTGVGTMLIDYMRVGASRS